MRVGVDVDGTLANIHKPLIAKISDMYRIELSTNDITDWNWGPLIRRLGLTGSDCVDMTDEIWASQWSIIPLTDVDIVTALSSIKEKCTVDIVTSRVVESAVKKWLAQHKIPYDNFVLSKDKHELDYDFYVEDDPYLAEILPPGRIVFLYNRPYNRNVPQGENVVRFSSFGQLPGLINKAVE
jgi:uncharacterized HAD superfamily protein